MQVQYVPYFDSSLPSLCAATSCLADPLPGKKYCAKHYKAWLKGKVVAKHSRPDESLARYLFKKEYIVYFIQSGPDGKIKIGKTHHLAQRISTMRTGNPYDVKLLAALSLPSADVMNNLERNLHACLRFYRGNGEWFDPSEDVLAVVECAKNGDMEAMKEALAKARSY